MPEGNQGDLTELRERIVRLEVRLEELNKRVDSLASYAKELYNYLQKARV